MTGLIRAKFWLATFLSIAVLASPLSAQTFPSKTIRIIVPYPPGGSIDLTARVIAKNLQDSVGQSVIVENKPGANAAIGIDALLRSEPDGHTLVLLSDSPVTINVHLAHLSYDAQADLVPIGKVVISPIVLTANGKAGIASIADLMATAKAKPLSYAVAARGSSAHLMAVMLQRELGISMQAVPYRGGAPAAVAIASGEVPLGMTDTAAILPMIDSGQIVALGVADPVRAQSMPNIPTLKEAASPISAPARGSRCLLRAARLTTVSQGSMRKSARYWPCRRRKKLCSPPVSSLLQAVRVRCAASSKRTPKNGAS
jgi:tripartite-type tricarboxylate transporter receptor subunit TctC